MCAGRVWASLTTSSWSRRLSAHCGGSAAAPAANGRQVTSGNAAEERQGARELTCPRPTFGEAQDEPAGADDETSGN